jgi:hypothetical protein
MKLAAIATSFAIGLITGVSLLPSPNPEPMKIGNEQLRRAADKNQARG